MPLFLELKKLEKATSSPFKSSNIFLEINIKKIVKTHFNLFTFACAKISFRH